MSKDLVTLYKDWENQREPLGEAEILEKEYLWDIIPEFIGDRPNYQGRTFKIYKIRFIFHTLTTLGKTRYKIGEPHNNVKLLSYKKTFKKKKASIEYPALANVSLC